MLHNLAAARRRLYRIADGRPDPSVSWAAGRLPIMDPAVRLSDPETRGRGRDVIRAARKLEQVIVDALAAVGIKRREGLTGCGLAAKIAAIGVGIRRWTTLHGLWINVATDQAFFEHIVPCGITGCRMTSITERGRPAIRVMEFATIIARAFAAVFA
jgi:lipoate-protein ligase B